MRLSHAGMRRRKVIDHLRASCERNRLARERDSLRNSIARPQASAMSGGGVS
jgi:hypothetical protein